MSVFDNFQDFADNYYNQGMNNLFPSQTETLSFNDIDQNELWLLGLPTPKNFVAELAYVTDMNERFIHTFLGDFS